MLKHFQPSIFVGDVRAAAFGRLCVETVIVAVRSLATGGSRLRAAVC